MLCFPGTFHSRKIQVSHAEYLLAVGREVVFAAAIEGLGTVLLEVRRYSLRHIDLFSHSMMKVSHPVRSAVNKHCIARSVLHWVVTMWESLLLNSLIVLLIFRLNMSVYNALEPLLVYLLDLLSVNESAILFPPDDVGKVMNE